MWLGKHRPYISTLIRCPGHTVLLLQTTLQPGRQAWHAWTPDERLLARARQQQWLIAATDRPKNQVVQQHPALQQLQAWWKPA